MKTASDIYKLSHHILTTRYIQWLYTCHMMTKILLSIKI